MAFEIKIPKIKKTIHLSEYAKEFGDASLDMWVNFPKALLVERNGILIRFNQAVDDLKTAQEAEQPDQESIDKIKTQITDLNNEMKRWYGKIWEQNGEALTEDEISLLFSQSEETDPMFMNWLISKTFELIDEHREARKN